MSSMLAATMSLAVLILLISHIYFVFTSSCSVEAGFLAFFNPFYESYDSEKKGCLKSFSRRNFYQIFGTKPVYWFFPINTPEKYRTCDGYNWKIRKTR